MELIIQVRILVPEPPIVSPPYLPKGAIELVELRKLGSHPPEDRRRSAGNQLAGGSPARGHSLDVPIKISVSAADEEIVQILSAQLNSSDRVWASGGWGAEAYR